MKYKALFDLLNGQQKFEMLSAANLGGVLRAISFHHSVLANV